MTPVPLLMIQWASVRIVRESISVPVQLAPPGGGIAGLNSATTFGWVLVVSQYCAIPPAAAAAGSLRLTALAGWAIERAMDGVPLTQIAERRAIVRKRLSDDLNVSLPASLGR